MLCFELDEEFYKRVKHNFRTYVLLTSLSVNWSEDEILLSIYRLNGYKSHKTVKYGQNTSHIHVRFEEDYLASEAVEFLNQLNSDLKAILLDDMLRDWFNYEMKAGHSPPCTVAIVDIVGCPPHGINLLTNYVLDSILEDFGTPYLLPYTAAVAEPHLQVVFKSMAEALAACIAFGEWYNVNSKLDNFSYRVRINPFRREEKLIKNSGGTPAEAFKLDYFCNIRNETRISKGSDSLIKPNISRPDVFSSDYRMLQRFRQQKLAAEAEQLNLVNHVGYRAPVLYIPLFPPSYNRAPYCETWMASNQLGSDFSTSVDFQQPSSSSIPTVATTNNYGRNYAAQYECIEGYLQSDCNDLDQVSQALEKHSDDLVVPQKKVSFPQKVHFSSTKSKRTHKATRVFERRK